MLNALFAAPIWRDKAFMSTALGATRLLKAWSKSAGAATHIQPRIVLPTDPFPTYTRLFFQIGRPLCLPAVSSLEFSQHWESWL